MIILDIKKTFNHKKITYLGSHKYVMSDDIAEELGSIYHESIGIRYQLEIYHKQYKGEDLTDKNLLVYRRGGLGDMLFIEPSIRALKDKYPSCKISVATQRGEPLLNNPAIYKIYDYPFDLEIMQANDYHLYYSDILEGGMDIAKTMSAVDIFSKVSCIKLTDTKPKIYLDKLEIDCAKNTFKNLGITNKDYVVMIQLESSSLIRNIPVNKLRVIVDKLANDINVKILLVGNSPQQSNYAHLYKGSHKNVIPCTTYTARQIIALSNESSILIAPDSFLIQIFGALNKPMVGVYNAFSSSLRMSQFKNAIGLDVMVACSPCHMYTQSCLKGNPPPCFSQIKPDDILSALDYLRFKLTDTHFNFYDKLKPNPKALNATH